MLKIKQKILLGSLEHGGEECYSHKCNQKNGKCAWCGTGGYCCRIGHKGGGCNGFFGGPSMHQCVLKPTSDKCFI